MNPGYIGAGLVKGQKWAAPRCALLCCARTRPRVRMHQRPLSEQRDPPPGSCKALSRMPATPAHCLPAARPRRAPREPQGAVPPHHRCRAGPPAHHGEHAHGRGARSGPGDRPALLPCCAACQPLWLPTRRPLAAHPISATTIRTLPTTPSRPRALWRPRCWRRSLLRCTSCWRTCCHRPSTTTGAQRAAWAGRGCFTRG